MVRPSSHRTSPGASAGVGSRVPPAGPVHPAEHERRASPRPNALEQPLEALEQRLFDLGVALHRQDVQAVDRVAAELHLALSAAVVHFSEAARQGTVPLPLRQRLAAASGQVAAQREALARATASLDRAIEVLMPQSGPSALYSADGRRSGNPWLA